MHTVAKVPIKGNTFAVREHLKALGGHWSPDQKVWLVPEPNAAQAKRLVQAGPGVSKPRPQRGPRKCVMCGAVEHWDARGYATVRVYRSGECRDCYEERKMGS